MNLTWKQLAMIINDLPEERQEDNVTIYDEARDEYLPLEDVKIANENHDVLDPDSLFLWLPE